MSTCQTCRHCKESEIDAATLKKSFVCKRFPPTPAVIPTSQGITMIALHPAVESNNQCGEYALKLDS